jgi:hypothetical protein
MLTHFVVGNGLEKKTSGKKFVEELKKFVEELKKFVEELKKFVVKQFSLTKRYVIVQV